MDSAVIKRGDTIVLTKAQVMRAAHLGIERRINKLFRKGKDLYGSRPEMGWQYDVQGALAESAFAQISGGSWKGANHSFHRFDVLVGATTVEVRSAVKDSHRLTVKDKDRGNIMVLMIGCDHEWRFAGCIPAHEALQHDEWIDTIRDEYREVMAPQDALRDFVSL